MKRRIIGAIALILLFCGPLSTSALAQDPSGKGWAFDLAPLNFWFIQIASDISMPTTGDPVKLDYSDVFNQYEAMFTLHFDSVYNQKWGFFAGLDFISIRGGNWVGDYQLLAYYRNAMVEAAGFYRFNLGDHTLEPFVGLRYNTIETKVDVVGLARGLRETADWTDAIVGLRYGWSLSRQWKFRLRGDAGFGNSNHAWQALGLFEYRPKDNFALVFGYRYLDTDYDKVSGNGRFEYKAQLHGPLLGFGFSW